MILKDFKKRLPLIYIGITVIFFVTRIILFASSYGGVEHDSGWYLGVAKNLALKGIYASYTNTIREESVGDHPSIHGRFSVQDKNGFSYFPAGVTVGPGYVVPQALLLKIFGDGWLQYRLWPLIAFTILLFIIFYTIWRIGGIISLIIFQIWLWAVPQLTTTYAYESYSEDIAFLYLIVSFILYYLSIKSKKGSLLILISGSFLSFSILTKNLFFLPGISFLISFLLEGWNHRKQIKKVFIRWILFATGFALPIGLYEGYRYFFLVSHFGHSSWSAINEDIRLTFQSGGSGILSLNLRNLDWIFILKKINIWFDVGIKQSFLIWAILLFSPLIILRFSPKSFRIIIALFYFSFLISFLWFIFVSPTGWARHAWQGIVLGMIIVSMTFGLTLTNALKSIKKSIFKVLIVIVLLISAIRYEGLEMGFNLNQDTIKKWRLNRFIRGLEGLPSTPILSLKDQKELVNFFNENVKEEDRIYYAGWFLNAEVSPLVDKVFYTLDRYFTFNQKTPDEGRSFLILGPYQQGPWSFEPPEYVPNKISELCINVVFKNPSYILCELKTGLVYNNPAY